LTHHFISATLVLPAIVRAILKSEDERRSELVLLVKPNGLFGRVAVRRV